MPRLIASSCLHIINHFHRREPLARSRAEGKHDHMPRPPRSGCPTIVHAHVFSVLKKPNRPSLPLSPHLLPSPSLPALPASFWKESAVLMDFVLSPWLLVHDHLHSPLNITHPGPHSRILCLTPSPHWTPHPPCPTQLYQSRDLNFVSVPPSPSAVYVGHSKSFASTPRRCHRPAESPAPLSGAAGLRAHSLAPPYTATRKPRQCKGHGQLLPVPSPSLTSRAFRLFPLDEDPKPFPAARPCPGGLDPATSAATTSLLPAPGLSVHSLTHTCISPS